jgi:hypothetical protein
MSYVNSTFHLMQFPAVKKRRNSLGILNIRAEFWSDNLMGKRLRGSAASRREDKFKIGTFDIM